MKPESGAPYANTLLVSVPPLFFSGHHLAVPSLLPIVQLLSGTVLFSPNNFPRGYFIKKKTPFFLYSHPPF
ncbi:hypothetical protein, partial [Shigella boydii]|uniref:hypothetical protein n=1 Tax=Shigella boydii TaxID=621 RepID=UPI002094B601